MNYKKTVVIIPAFNEELNIKNLILSLAKSYKDIFILVLDDSKNKLTFNEFHKAKYKKSRIIYRGKKLGRGNAVRAGMKIALKKKFSTIVEMDGDFSHNPNQLKYMLKLFYKEKLDLLIGSRYLQKSKIINWPKNRIVFSFFANLLARFLFKFSYSDYTNGYRIYTNQLVKKIISYNQISVGFLYLTETLYIAIKNNFIIKESPITFKNRVKGNSSVTLYSIIKSFLDIILIKIKL